MTAALAAAALYSALWLTALARGRRARLAVAVALSAALLLAALLGQGVSDLRREQIARVQWRNEAWPATRPTSSRSCRPTPTSASRCTISPTSPTASRPS